MYRPHWLNVDDVRVCLRSFVCPRRWRHHGPSGTTWVFLEHHGPTGTIKPGSSWKQQFSLEVHMDLETTQISLEHHPSTKLRGSSWNTMVNLEPTTITRFLWTDQARVFMDKTWCIWNRMGPRSNLGPSGTQPGCPRRWPSSPSGRRSRCLRRCHLRSAE